MAYKVTCGWCGKTIVGHGGDHECAEGDTARNELRLIGERLRLVVSILTASACVFGEEPLAGALARLQAEEENLAAIVGTRDANLRTAEQKERGT